LRLGRSLALPTRFTLSRPAGTLSLKGEGTIVVLKNELPGNDDGRSNYCSRPHF
jgi:hypothetical protein